MNKSIHPQTQIITIACACGKAFKVDSTLKNDITVEICSNCHPFYTGRSKLVDTARRIDKFEARRQKAQDLQAKAKNNKPEVTETKA